MENVYLNGRIKISSISTPTQEDMDVIDGLSENDRIVLTEEILEKAKSSPMGIKSVDDIWNSAFEKATLSIDKKSEYALETFCSGRKGY